MRRILLGTTGLVVTTLIAMVLMAWAVPVDHAVSTHAAPLAVPPTPAAHTPLAASVGNASALATFTNSFSIGVSPFYVLPINVTWTEVEVNATITDANLTMYLNVTYKGVPAFAAVFTGSQDVSCASATKCSYASGPITTADILGTFGATAVTFPTGQYIFKLTSNATNSSSATPNATASVIQASSNLAPYPAFGQFLSPLGSVSAGQLTVAGNYSGDYLTGATVTVLNATKGEVFSDGVFSTLPQYAFAVFWTATTAGTYELELTLTEQWGATLTFFANVTVTVGVISTHTYSNSTWGIDGLGPGGSAAVIITIGIVIGIIVMALVGRGMWGGAPTAAAQPWSGQKPSTTGAPGTFECPTCHQSFPSQDALNDHEKSQHGVTT